MSSSIIYQIDADGLLEEIKRREKDAEDIRKFEFKAAVKIQKLARGFLERKHLSRVSEAAEIIQRNWRGYLGRLQYLRTLRTASQMIIKDFYHDKAAEIQRLWRGFRSRSSVHHHQSFREWKKAITQKNLELDSAIKIFGAMQKKKLDADSELCARENVLFILFKIHHILRTETTPGVYSLLDTDQLSTLEEQVKELNLTEYVETLHLHRNSLRRKYESIPPPNLENLKWHRKCHEFWFNRKRAKDRPLLEEEDFVDLCKREECRCDAFRKSRIPTPGGIENPPMKFPLVDSLYYPELNGEEPYKEVNFTLRERRPSKEIHENPFSKVYHSQDISETYKLSKYGPFRGNISETDIFIQRHEEKCRRKQEHNDD